MSAVRCPTMEDTECLPDITMTSRCRLSKFFELISIFRQHLNDLAFSSSTRRYFTRHVHILFRPRGHMIVRKLGSSRREVNHSVTSEFRHEPIIEQHFSKFVSLNANFIVVDTNNPEINTLVLKSKIGVSCVRLNFRRRFPRSRWSEICMPWNSNLVFLIWLSSTRANSLVLTELSNRFHHSARMLERKVILVVALENV